jgi:hypothetical protein
VKGEGEGLSGTYDEIGQEVTKSKIFSISLGLYYKLIYICNLFVISINLTNHKLWKQKVIFQKRTVSGSSMK